MKYHIFSTLLAFSIAFTSVFGQIPEYYRDVDFSTNGTELLEQLAQLVSTTHVFEISYTPGVWDALKQTDLDPENSELVLLVYGYNDHDGNYITDRTRGVDENCSQSDCSGLWNREHVLARSQADPSLQLNGAGSDVHNVRASDAGMNEIRGSRRFAFGDGNAGVTTTGDFFPGEEWMGDVARMVMYMFLRYGDRCDPAFVAVGTSLYDPEGRMIDLLLEWNAADPVSEYEMVRNEILEGLQGNRNPFIDNPYLATAIWGGPDAEERWPVSITNHDPLVNILLYPTLSSGTIYFTNSTDESFEYRIFNKMGQLKQVGKTNGQIEATFPCSGWHFVELIHSSYSTVQKVYFLR